MINSPDEVATVSALWGIWPQALLMRPDYDHHQLHDLVEDGFVELIVHDNDVGVEVRLAQAYGERLEGAQRELADLAGRN